MTTIRFRNIIFYSLQSIAGFLLAAMLFSCENSMEKISSLGMNDTLAAESARDIEIIYSDSGKILIKLISPVVNRYQKEEPYIEFPKGLHLLFYDSALNIKSDLTADYGISWEKKKIVEVKSNVVINNFEKNEILNSEHLIWDQVRHKIYSNVFAKRTTPDGVLYGDGFDADESLQSYKLRNPRGVFSVDDDAAE